jgi:toxin ParE1/3/4
MSAVFFHPEALFEYQQASSYYLRKASPSVAAGFISSVELAVDAVTASPMRWGEVDQPGIRRYVLRRFPYVIYYRWQTANERIIIYAVMHCSRHPGYWRNRVEDAG